VPLVLNPILQDSVSGIPFAFSIAMGVRRRDHELRDSLQQVLDRKRPEIEAILRQYGVPLFPIRIQGGQPAPRPRTARRAPERAPRVGSSPYHPTCSRPPTARKDRS